jgi:integrase
MVSSMANVEGSGYIVQRDKSKPKSKCRKWELRVPTGLDPRTGKYKTKSRRFNGTYTEAKKALREFVDEIEHDSVQGRTSYTFEEYCERFLERRALGKEVAETTQKRQRWQFKAACRHIGKANLASITPAMLDDMYIAMLKGDTLSGKPSSGSYVNQIHDNITLVFEQAKKEGILVKNPCDAANPPKMDTKEKRALNPDRAHVFIAMLDEKDDRECAYLLAITMGLRRGEICGLSWGDIDFERGIVDISHSYDTLGNLKGTKTKAGMRLLPLPENVAEALREHKKAQKERYDRTNQWRKPEEGYIEQTDESPVISDISGGRVLPSNLSRWWTEDRAKYGLEGWCLHELRHTYLTMLALSGVHPKVMQELAGHYSSQITMDIYTHVNMDAKRDAVAAVSKAFA